MGFTIKPKYWLKTEADKIEGILLMARNWGTTWTASSLQLYLQGQDLIYTVDQCGEILDELVNRGVLVED